MTHFDATEYTAVTITTTEPTSLGDRSTTTAGLIWTRRGAEALAVAIEIGTLASDALPYWPSGKFDSLYFVGQRVADLALRAA